MATTISARRVASLVGSFDTSPAYAGLADALRLLIGDGRIGLDVRLPSERELTEAVGVSRTTVTRAYALLRESGYAEARQGSGTYTRVPDGRRRAHDRAFYPGFAGDDAIDLNCAAPSAPPGVAAAYAAAAEQVPAHLGGHGYFPYGLPALREAIAATYEARGLPTHPDQVMVTTGALAGASLVAQAFTGAGDRVVVESPTYPNATAAVRHAGARLVPAPIDPDAYDVEAVAAVVRQATPRAAYLIPDFQNPTGHLMTDEQREHLAGTLRRSRTLAVVDEAHQAVVLDPVAMPRPFAHFSPDAITIGSASKSFWGGLRLGWLRAPLDQMERLLHARTHLDLGAPVFEQLVLTQLLRDPEPVLAAHLDRLREQRDALVTGVRDHLPEWRFHVPAGGLALWCELPGALGTAVTAEAERHGVVLAPGPVFAVEGGLDRFVRLPWTRPADELVEAVRRVARAWEQVRETTTARGPGRPGRPGLVA